MPEAHINLGIACWRRGNLGEAESALRHALALHPNNTVALTALGIVYAEQSRFDLARLCQEQVVALRPKDAQAHRDLGMSLFRTGDTAAALNVLRRSVELAPQFTAGWNSLGWALRALGRFDEALECFDRALAIDPGLSEARRSRAETGRHIADVSEIARLAAQFDDLSVDTAKRIPAGFALGSLLDKQDRFDEAFACFVAANAMVRQTLVARGRSYDQTATASRVDGIIQTVTPEFLTAVGRGGNPSELPVFIVGMPRSGTTLVEQIAASHSRVFGAGELNDVPRMSAELPSPATDPDTIALWQKVGGGMSNAYLAKLRSFDGHAARVTDKLPDNVFHLGTVAALFPRARVILCLRDERDIGLSNFFQLFAGGNPYSYDLEDCGHRCRQVERLFEHWRRVLPLRTLEVSYELLVSDLPGQSRRLIKFLDLPWEPACLDFHRTERVVVTQSTWQVRQPLYSRSVGRWRRYEDHLAPLLKALSATA